MVDYLIARGADMKAVCRDGRTLLHCAAVGGLVELMDRLIKQGFPVDGPDRYGRTPLSQGRRRPDRTRPRNSFFPEGRTSWAVNSVNSTPLHEATFSGNLRLLEILVKHGADVNALNEEGSTPLLYVIPGRPGGGHRLAARARSEARRPEQFQRDAADLSAGQRLRRDLVEKLWPRAEALKNRDLLEKYPLHRAAYLGHARPAAFLLGKGLPIDLKDESGRTPFQRAAQGGNVEIARMLLGKGAEVDAADAEGSTASPSGREERPDGHGPFPSSKRGRPQGERREGQDGVGPGGGIRLSRYRGHP